MAFKKYSVSPLIFVESGKGTLELEKTEESGDKDTSSDSCKVEDLNEGE